jgi:hypothetical protein
VRHPRSYRYHFGTVAGGGFKAGSAALRWANLPKVSFLNEMLKLRCASSRTGPPVAGLNGCRIKIIGCNGPEQLLVPRSRYLPLGFLR